MTQNLSEQLSLQQLSNTLGHSLSEAEFQSCLKQAKSLTPKVGKFWQGTDGIAGIYIVVAGKVRLLSEAGEIIVTLQAGASFGKFTLFKEGEFQPYAARASVSLQVCFIPGEVLSPLMAKYPQIREHLWNEAEARSRNSQQVDSNDLPVKSAESNKIHKNDILSTPAVEVQPQKKISKAYFPNPTQRVGLSGLFAILCDYP